jgi:hypothetical protein|tara:strand:+ start:3288 stop:3614 length:327 start_codon:yes stop_codon:yes gene_type:complete
MDRSLEELIKELADGIDKYNIPDWISFSAICREIDDSNVGLVVSSIPTKYAEAFYLFIQDSPRTNAGWDSYSIVGGEASLDTQEAVYRKAKYREGVEIVRKYIKRSKT